MTLDQSHVQGSDVGSPGTYLRRPSPTGDKCAPWRTETRKDVVVTLRPESTLRDLGGIVTHVETITHLV